MRVIKQGPVVDVDGVPMTANRKARRAAIAAEKRRERTFAKVVNRSVEDDLVDAVNLMDRIYK